MSIQSINIVLVIFTFGCLFWFLYNKYIVSLYECDEHPLAKTLVDFPTWFKCDLVPATKHSDIDQVKCSKVVVDGWTLMHILLYFTIGVFIPGHWQVALLVSILFEYYEYISGWKAKWIIDPVANMTGYLLGTYFAINHNFKKYFTSPCMTITCTLFLSLILALNRPHLMQHPHKYF